jgi:hypothetical protein
MVVVDSSEYLGVLEMRCQAVFLLYLPRLCRCAALRMDLKEMVMAM